MSGNRKVRYQASGRSLPYAPHVIFPSTTGFAPQRDATDFFRPSFNRLRRRHRGGGGGGGDGAAGGVPAGAVRDPVGDSRAAARPCGEGAIRQQVGGRAAGTAGG